jgi:hypothetical protein
MILTKQQIRKIEYAWQQAQKAQDIAEQKANDLKIAIVETLGIKGHVDYFPGDGLGFTPESNNDTHIYIGHLIDLAKDGTDITENFILDNLAF